jgi:hypothetical protein
MADMTGYMLGKLDTIREDQIRHGDLLQRLLEGTAAAGKTTKKTKAGLFSRLRNMPPFWQSIVAGGLMWIFGICISAYLKRGGDPMALIELGLKLLH